MFFLVDMGNKVNNAFGDFEDLMSWSTLSQEEQLSLYDKIACNETNYFMYRKVIIFVLIIYLPYYQSCSAKTFFPRQRFVIRIYC